MTLYENDEFQDVFDIKMMHGELHSKLEVVAIVRLMACTRRFVGDRSQSPEKSWIFGHALSFSSITLLRRRVFFVCGTRCNMRLICVLCYNACKTRLNL
jgi:hypothetical protein